MILYMSASVLVSEREKIVLVFPITKIINLKIP
jgi:hypothetical protein